MARGDLYKLAIEAQQFLKLDTKIYRAYYSDPLVHRYIVSYEDVRKQVYEQIATKIPSVDGASANLISRATGRYVEGLYKAFSRFSRSVDLVLEGTPRKFSVTIASQKGVVKTPFDFINETKKGLQEELVARVNEVLKPHDSGHKNFSANNFLDTGHLVAVSDRFIDDALTPIYDAAANSQEIAKLMASTLRLKIASKFKGTSKVFVIEASEESASGNRSKGAGIEKARLNAIKSRLNSFIAKNNWVDQPGSDSALEFIEKQLTLEISKIKGYKGKKPAKANTSPADASVVQTNTPKVRAYRESVKVRTKKQASNINLVALLNVKLPDEVRKRMTYPRLVNRTGTFADSVKAVAYSNNLIAYTYDKYPYQIFEMGLGKKPWATPQRDPRVIIDESIRSIATKLVGEKFNTRRV